MWGNVHVNCFMLECSAVSLEENLCMCLGNRIVVAILGLLSLSLASLVAFSKKDTKEGHSMSRQTHSIRTIACMEYENLIESGGTKRHFSPPLAV